MEKGGAMKTRFHRRSIRLRGFDYSQAGAYFITICTLNQRKLLGKRESDGIVLNVFGRIVQDEIMRLPLRFCTVFVISYSIMPDHVHLLLGIQEGQNSGAGGGACRGTTVVQPDAMASTRFMQGDGLREVDRCAPTMQFGKTPPGSIPIIVRSLKASVSWRIHRSNQFREIRIWQRNYFERVVRSQRELEQVFKYIEANPVEKT